MVELGGDRGGGCQGGRWRRGVSVALDENPHVRPDGGHPEVVVASAPAAAIPMVVLYPAAFTNLESSPGRPGAAAHSLYTHSKSLQIETKLSQFSRCRSHIDWSGPALLHCRSAGPRPPLVASHRRHFHFLPRSSVTCGVSAS